VIFLDTNEKSYLYLTAVVVVFLALLGLWVVSNKNGIEDTKIVEKSSSKSTITVSTDGETVTSEIDSSSENTDLNTELKNKAELSYIKTSLVSVTKDSSLKGEATISRTDLGLDHEVKAWLPDPQEGYSYEGWLVKDAAKGEFFSTGVMSKNDEGVYVLEYSSEDPSLGYNTVVITLESVVDETPEEHVLESQM